MSKLKDWKNAAKAGTRFPPSRFKCPQCNEPALEDTWPPNYWGGSGSFGQDAEFNRSGCSKCVCVPCKISFVVSVREQYKGTEKVLDEQKPYDVKPLVERDGFLLTTHDVWREDYKAEHGEYPYEAYA